MSDVTATFHGVDEFRNNLRKLKGGLRAGVQRELYADTVAVMAESQEIVPYRTGELHDSGEVDRPVTTGSGIHVKLHYGSPTVRYALKQHEDLQLQHPNGGQPKFLETPLRKWTAKGPADVVKRALKDAL
jgi:hypothetical protein